METWEEITNRHKKEKFDLVQGLGLQGLTQAQASRKLQVKRTMLNNYIHRNKVRWPVIRQGVKINE